MLLTSPCKSNYVAARRQTEVQIMQILGYGEDALTLWAMKNKLDVILEALNDSSDPSTCQVFFRPSFGRSGGDKSPQFGEFDFIILSQNGLYLGESKDVNPTGC